MVRCFILIIVSTIYIPAISQDFIGNTRGQVKRKLERYVSKEKTNVQWQETLMSLTLSIRDTNYKPAEFIFGFNKNNKCNVEARIACGTCIQKYLQAALNNKKFEWIQLNDSNYISKHSKGLAIEVLKKDSASYLRIKKLL